MIFIESYKCGCSDEQDTKSELLGYCAKHGESRKTLYALPDDPDADPAHQEGR